MRLCNFINNHKTKIMSDSKSDTGSPDRDRINLSEDYEVRYWCEKFGVTAEQLQEAVERSGDRADKVEENLKKNRA